MLTSTYYTFQKVLLSTSMLICRKLQRSTLTGEKCSHQYSIKTETIRVIEQTVFTRRQLTFEIYRNNNSKIGMNTQANKFYHISKLIALDKLNLGYVHFKKIMKCQFLKYGKTWYVHNYLKLSYLIQCFKCTDCMKNKLHLMWITGKMNMRPVINVFKLWQYFNFA